MGPAWDTLLYGTQGRTQQPTGDSMTGPTRSRILLVLLALTVASQPALSASMAANQSTIKSFLGGSGGILAFVDAGASSTVKWVDLNDASLAIRTLSSQTNCRDVIISHAGAAVQAAAAGHSLQAELALLAVHGTLHLLGHDHATPKEKATMWAAQEAILAQLGLNLSLEL